MMNHILGPGPTIIIIQSIFISLTLAAVLLRLWARSLKKRQLALNDWAAVAALFFNFCLAAISYETVAAGMGQHVQDLKDPETQVTIVIKSLLALEALWATVNASVKVSILHLYTTIFLGKRFMMITYTIMAISVGYAVASLLQTVLVCRPITKSWNEQIQGSCGNTAIAYEAFGFINLLIDLAIVILPMPSLWELQLPIAKKVALTAIFGVGFVICVFSAIRIESLARWDFSDITWGMGKVAVWSVLEPSLGIVNCCLPVLGPIVEKVHTSAIWTRYIGRNRTTSRDKIPYHGGFNRNAGGHDTETGPFKLLANPRIPLEGGSNTTNHISSSKSGDLYSHFEDDQSSTHLRAANTAVQDAITVQRRWEVEVERFDIEVLLDTAISDGPAPLIKA